MDFGSSLRQRRPSFPNISSPDFHVTFNQHKETNIHIRATVQPTRNLVAVLHSGGLETSEHYICQCKRLRRDVSERMLLQHASSNLSPD